MEHWTKKSLLKWSLSTTMTSKSSSCGSSDSLWVTRHSILRLRSRRLALENPLNSFDQNISLDWRIGWLARYSVLWTKREIKWKYPKKNSSELFRSMMIRISEMTSESKKISNRISWESSQMHLRITHPRFTLNYSRFHIYKK
jgi:hypothetical protein